MEYWFGWFDVWSESHHVFPAEDHDASLSEAGDYTTKYQLLRNVFSQFHCEKLPEAPSLQARRVYEPVIIQKRLSLWESLQFTDKPLKSEGPVNMENSNNGQSYGYTQYETTISSGGLLNSKTNFRD
ncbi:beta-galactosidase-1-like protein 2 isoform X2 [Salmo trutta]|nr:beta-galactosidase-1-like protein 2 isoform X2 [Salmo trutta]